MAQLLQAGEIDDDALDDIVEFGDARHAWYVADLMRFFGAGDGDDRLVEAFEALTAPRSMMTPTASAAPG